MRHLPDVLLWADMVPSSFWWLHPGISGLPTDGLREPEQRDFYGFLETLVAGCPYRWTPLSIYGQSGHGSHKFFNRIKLTFLDKEKICISVLMACHFTLKNEIKAK